MEGWIIFDFNITPWDLIASGLLVLGVPLAMTMVAGGVVGVVIKEASAAHGLLIGLVVGTIGAASSIGALMVAEDHLGVDTGDLLPGILIVVGVGLLFAGITSYLTWRLRGQHFWKMDRTI